ncbi:MAG: vWA domain-containing protein [Pseudomonadota bacterium]
MSPQRRAETASVPHPCAPTPTRRGSLGVRLLACSAAWVGASLFSSIALAQPSASLAIVFDGSGSMWGPVTGGSGAKFQVAREGLGTALTREGQSPPRLAIFGFGIRRRGSCNGAESLIGFSETNDPSPALTAMRRLNPRGRGPIAAAMEKAGAALEAEQAPRHLLVVHDDNDNCRADPCAVAAALKQKMPDLKVHALTLRESATTPLMACFSDLTGGTVVQTLDRDEVIASLRQLTSLAATSQPPPRLKKRPEVEQPKVQAPVAETPAAAGLTYRDGQTGLVLAANLAASGPRYVGPIRWRIVRRDGDKDGRNRRVSVADTVAMPLAAGQYEISAETDIARATETVEVKADKTGVLILNLRSGAITFTAALGDTAAPVDGTRLTIRKTNKEGQPVTGPPVFVGLVARTPIVLPESSYLVSARKGGLEETIRLDVSAGAAQAVAMRLPGAALRVRLNAPSQTTAEPEITVFTKAVVTTSATPTWREVDRANGLDHTFYLLPGTYRITAKIGAAEVNRQLAIRGGQSLELPLALRATQVEFSTEIDALQRATLAARMSYTIQSLDNPESPPQVVYGADPRVALVPGRYRITSRVDEPGSVATETVVIAPTRRQRVRLTHAVGRIRMQIFSTGRVSRRAANDWVVYDVQGTAVWRGLGQSAEALLPPGRYLVEAGGRKNQRREVQLVAGATVDVTLAKNR